MKTNHFYAHYSLIVVTACLLSASCVRAQTFMGQEKLAASPASLEASIYPVINTPATIRVNFNNWSAGGVQVSIVDEKGHKVYSEFETVARYRRRFDLSSLPSGKYTLKLTKQDDQFAQTFTIEPPAMGHISMGNQPVQKTPEQPVDKKLIVSY